MTDPEPQTRPPPERPRSGPTPTLEGGRARSPLVDETLWSRVGPPKSAFVRDALTAYLAAPEPAGARPRDEHGRFQSAGVSLKRVGVYVEDAQWTALGALPGTITGHFDAALRRALGDA